MHYTCIKDGIIGDDKNSELKVRLLSLEHGKQYSYNYGCTQQRGIYLSTLCSVVPEQNKQGIAAYDFK